MLGSMLLGTIGHTVAHSGGFHAVRWIGVVGGLVAFFALVLRHPARREAAIASGHAPTELGVRGLRPSRPRQWWFPPWFVRTPEGWRRLDRALVMTAIAGGSVLGAAIVVTGAAGLH